VRINVNISSIKILDRSLSITFDISSFEDTEKIRDLKKRDISFKIYNSGQKIAWFKGQIVSFGMRSSIYFVVHTIVSKPIINRLIDIRNEDCVLIIFEEMPISREGEKKRIEPAENESGHTETVGDKDIEALVKLASIKIDITPEDLIEKLTSFEKNGQMINGKRDINRISNKQKVVILDKVRKIIGLGGNSETKEEPRENDVPVECVFEKNKKNRNTPEDQGY